jgi:hypothetical protein
MKIKNYIYIGLLIYISIFISSCKKAFLDKKPATNLNVPSTLSDLQLFLDNRDIYRSPALGEDCSDDYYMTYDQWTTQFFPYTANAYVWAKDIFAGQGNIADWNTPYTKVLYANIALEQLNNIKRNATNGSNYDNIKGAALLMRAWAFFDLSQVFSLPYDNNTASSDLGIPLRLTADINAPSTRATVKATYEQIFSDVNQARSLLTNPTSLINQNRPSRAAVYGFLSRIYLTMRNYPQAGLYADSALQLQHKLINYNLVDSTTSVPFGLTNDETIYQNFIVDSAPLIYIEFSEEYSIDTLLYQSYEKNDLRKVIYFEKNGIYINKKDGYSGGSVFSNGITSDELYLTRAECFARANNSNKALDDLNALLVNRWKTGTYVPVTNLQGTNLLNMILMERRKELVMRALRWNDIRRLNKEGYNIVLTRSLNDKTYILPPNDPRYALPIPPDVISHSSIPQNNR